MNLEQAIETITEGGSALGVSCDDVYKRMMQDSGFAIKLMTSIHEGSPIYESFHAQFTMAAMGMLKEAKRASQEVEAGLL